MEGRRRLRGHIPEMSPYAASFRKCHPYPNPCKSSAPPSPLPPSRSPCCPSTPKRTLRSNRCSSSPAKVSPKTTFNSAQLGNLVGSNKGDLAGQGRRAGRHHQGIGSSSRPCSCSACPTTTPSSGSPSSSTATRDSTLSYNSAKGHLFPRPGDRRGPHGEQGQGTKRTRSRKLSALAKASGKIAPGEWHTMLVEVLGGKVSVQTDTGLKAKWKAANSTSTRPAIAS